MEEWKEINGYNGLYSISNVGRVRSYIQLKNNEIVKSHVPKIILPSLTNGYLGVSLISPKREKNRVNIHRLVATHFIPNPEHKPQVNHKNGDKLDNSVENLEWVTASENQKHAYRTGLKKPNGARKVLRSDGEIFESAVSAGRAMGLKNGGHVSDVCNGKRRASGGYHFSYID